MNGQNAGRLGLRRRVPRHIEKRTHHRAGCAFETYILDADAACRLDLVRKKAATQNQRPTQQE